MNITSNVKQSMSSNTQSVEDHPQSLDLSSLELYTNEQADLGGVTLSSGKYQLRKIIRRDNHYNVYSVKHLPPWSRELTGEVEARTYLLDGIPSKLRKYRLRSMQRLSSRKILEQALRGLVIVVYTVESKTVKESEKKTISQAMCQIRTEIEDEVFKPKQKSDYQREVTRRRQLERRQMNRRKEKEVNEEREVNEEIAGMEEKGWNEEEEWREATENEGEGSGDNHDFAHEEEERLYVLLHAAYQNFPELLQSLPPVSSDMLEKHLQYQAVMFEDEQEMEVFLGIKLQECIFLSIQKNTLQEKLAQSRDELVTLGALWGYWTAIEKRLEYQDTFNMAERKLDLVSNILKLLPQVMHDTEVLLHTLTRISQEARNLEKRIENQEALYVEFMRLERRAKVCEAVADEMVRESALHAQAKDRIKTAMQGYNVFNSQWRDGFDLRASISLLRVQHRNLMDLKYK